MLIYWDTFKEKFKRHKKPLFPSGSRVYKGFQGQGKTLSMVAYAFYIQKICPDAIIYSNIFITGLNNYHYFNDNKGLTEAISCNNGLNGVLVLLDEAHLFFNKKDGISLDVSPSLTLFTCKQPNQQLQLTISLTCFLKLMSNSSQI